MTVIYNQWNSFGDISQDLQQILWQVHKERFALRIVFSWREFKYSFFCRMIFKSLTSLLKGIGTPFTEGGFRFRNLLFLKNGTDTNCGVDEHQWYTVVKMVLRNYDVSTAILPLLRIIDSLAYACISTLYSLMVVSRSSIRSEHIRGKSTLSWEYLLPALNLTYSPWNEVVIVLPYIIVQIQLVMLIKKYPSFWNKFLITEEIQKFVSDQNYHLESFNKTMELTKF